MVEESEPDPTKYLECPSCHELNRRGTVECARCGETLPAHSNFGVDPELAAFNSAQHAAVEAREREGTRSLLRYIGVTYKAPRRQ
jgi:hypothetical protein